MIEFFSEITAYLSLKYEYELESCSLLVQSVSCTFDDPEEYWF